MLVISKLREKGWRFFVNRAWEKAARCKRICSSSSTKCKQLPAENSPSPKFWGSFLCLCVRCTALLRRCSRYGPKSCPKHESQSLLITCWETIWESSLKMVPNSFIWFTSFETSFYLSWETLSNSSTLIIFSFYSNWLLLDKKSLSILFIWEMNISYSSPCRFWYLKKSSFSKFFSCLVMFYNLNE